jgi:threonyl-tRNA synthetase
MVILGDKELESGQVAVRHRSGKDLGQMPVERFLDLLQTQITSRHDPE